MICFVAYAWITMQPVVLVIQPPVQLSTVFTLREQMEYMNIPAKPYHVARI